MTSYMKNGQIYFKLNNWQILPLKKESQQGDRIYLEAEIKLILKKNKFELLDKLDLADYFIVSKAEKELSDRDEIKIEVKKAKGQKCERCWKIWKKCERCSKVSIK